MGDGYVRQSAADIVTGNTVEAGPLNAEFNQLRDAFHEASGHAHDGTTGEGPKISLTTSISGVLPVANGGIAGIHKLNATTAPVAADDNTQGYAVGSKWIDTTNDKSYEAVDVTTNTAIWQQYTGLGAYQPLDSDLTAIAALTSAANKGLQSTGAGTWALYDLTAAGKALLDDADAAAQLVTLGLTATASEINILDGLLPTQTELNYVDGVTSAIQTQIDGKQPLDGDLTAIAALAGTNNIYYRSGASTWTAVTIDPSLSFTGGTLSVVASGLDPELAAIGGLTSAADQLPYFTGSGTAALTTMTSFARTLLDDTNQAGMRTTLGLTPGTDVQAYDADLAALAGLSGVQGDIIYRDASQWQRLPKGTANQEIRMNAGATAPEWYTPSAGSSFTMPVGSLVDYAGTTAPSLWLLCYGQAISRATYSALFTAISTTYGVGDGSTTFNLPDHRGRVSAGKDDMGGSSANRLTNPTGSTIGGIDGDVLGGTGGSETHVITTAQLAAHTHPMPANQSAIGTGVTLQGTTFVHTNINTGSAGSDTPHNNVQPTIILNKIIYAGV